MIPAEFAILVTDMEFRVIEVVFGGFIAAIIGMGVYIWQSSEKRTDRANEASEKRDGDLATTVTALEKKCEEREKDIWKEINLLKKEDNVIGAAVEGLRSDIKGIERRLEAMPDHEALRKMFADSEARQERHLDRVLGFKGSK
jgi:hypothetical protein